MKQPLYLNNHGQGRVAILDLLTVKGAMRVSNMYIQDGHLQLPLSVRGGNYGETWHLLTVGMLLLLGLVEPPLEPLEDHSVA